MFVTVIVPEFVPGLVRREVLPVDAVAERVQPLGVAPESLDSAGVRLDAGELGTAVDRHMLAESAGEPEDAPNE